MCEDSSKPPSKIHLARMEPDTEAEEGVEVIVVEVAK